MLVQRSSLVLPVVLFAVFASACAPEGGSLLGGGDGTAGGGATPPPSDGTQAVPACTSPGAARSYALFDGTKLEASRANEASGADMARLKPYVAMQGELQRVLGVVPDGLASAGGEFDDPPARWFEEPSYSGVSLNAMYDLLYAGCRSYAQTNPALAAAPTNDTANAQCTQLMRKAWSRTPTPDELDACRDLAVTKLASEPDVHTRWAYVCASVLSSSYFLTF